MLAAEFEPADAPGRRRAARAAVSIDARVHHDGLTRALCRVVDLSVHGVRLETYSALRRGAMIWLTLPHVGQVIADVAWATDFAAGCEFRTALTQESFDALIELDGSLQHH
ncbi:MAG TPA: PilZ domain-containing protein [Sphingomonas sp.]|nr:PilZ domain-containing protein [Sphingomonas sp.]